MEGCNIEFTSHLSWVWTFDFPKWVALALQWHYGGWKWYGGHTILQPEQYHLIAWVCYIWGSPVQGGRRRKSDGLKSTSPLQILKARMRSSRRRLRSSKKGLSWRSLSSCGTWRRPLTSRVARRWTLSSWFISAFSVGALASIAYSRCGRTKAQ